MKSLVELCASLLQDCSRLSGAPVTRDVETLRARVECEGDSFITITLPSFCQDFEKALDEGRLSSGMFPHFKKVKRHSVMPAFLQGLLRNVFDETGELRCEPSLVCIRLVRQICLFGKKVARPCTNVRERSAEKAYITCDSSVATELPAELGAVYREVADFVVASLKIEHRTLLDSIHPRHGPGATRERISGNQKWKFKRWHQRLTDVGFSYLRYGKGSNMFPLKGASLDVCELWPVTVQPRDEEPVRVVFVPKTLKSPRVIAVEPVCMQYAQQAFGRYLMRKISQSSLAAGHVNFTNQTVNQQLAKESSQHGFLATLDMSEASDRVGLVHVRELFASDPTFLSYLEACRSLRAQVPSGEVILLEKFASMGSALCFPVESLVFFTSILASLVYRLGLPVSGRLLRSLAEDVYVYGDDLIVPSDMASLICEDLESFGFKVNVRKSFSKGNFRESCGSDWYDGEKVTPVYLRRDCPASKKDASGLLSTIATANQLYEAGYWRTASALRREVEVLLGHLPQVPVDGPAVGWTHHSDVRPASRWNDELQRREYRVLTAVPVRRVDSLDGSEQALAKSFRCIGNPDIDEKHLTRTSTPHAVALKHAWGPYLN